VNASIYGAKQGFLALNAIIGKQNAYGYHLIPSLSQKFRKKSF
jgi:hypothetical protein